MTRFIITSLALVLAGCHASPPPVVDTSGLPISDNEIPPPTPIVPANADDVAACATVAMVGCSDAPICLTAISAARTDGVVIPTSCLTVAKSVAMVRACGDISTLTFDCGGN